MITDFERIVEITPAYDRRNPDANKNYGIHGCDLRMVLKGPLGAVQFVVYTNWHLPNVQRELDERLACDPSRVAIRVHGPMGADAGYHSYEPRYEGQTPMEDCPYLGGKPCYYDASGLLAEEWLNVLREGGSDAIWKKLEEWYHEQLVTADA